MNILTWTLEPTEQNGRLLLNYNVKEFVDSLEAMLEVAKKNPDEVVTMEILLDDFFELFELKQQEKKSFQG